MTAPTAAEAGVLDESKFVVCEEDECGEEFVDKGDLEQHRLDEHHLTTDEDDTEGHEDGDGCAIYYTGYTVKTPEGEKAVEDLNTGDYYNDPAFDPAGSWMEIDDIAILTDEGEVHIDGHYIDGHDAPDRDDEDDA